MIEQVATTVKNLTVEQMEVVQKVDVYAQNILKEVNTVLFVDVETVFFEYHIHMNTLLMC